jgi:hypothetical protein
MEIKPFKMKVTTEQSIKVQKIVFVNGGKWIDNTTEILRGGGATILLYNKQFSMYSGAGLSLGTSDYMFEKDTLPELSYDEFIGLYGTKYGK